MKTFGIVILFVCSVCFLGSVKNVQADIPTSGLVAYWEAENNANDSFAGNDGTASGGASYAAGQYGQAFNFNGNDEVVSIAHNVDLQPTSITVAAWIQTGSTTGLRLIIDKSHGGTGGNNGWALQLSSGKVAWAYGDGGGFPQLNGSLDVANNAFHHIAVTLDDTANMMRLYVDGNPDGTLAYTGTPTGNTRAVNIGAWYNSSAGPPFAREFVGNIDDVAIYNRALSQAEVRHLMNHAVPEPSGLAICLAGLAAWGVRRRRRQST